MYLWLCWYKNDEWACYVIASTRGRAKSLFHDYWNSICYGEYTDVRCHRVKPANWCTEAILDADCEVLEQLGVRYKTEAELEAMDY